MCAGCHSCPHWIVIFKCVGNFPAYKTYSTYEYSTPQQKSNHRKKQSVLIESYLLPSVTKPLTSESWQLSSCFTNTEAADRIDFHSAANIIISLIFHSNVSY